MRRDWGAEMQSVFDFGLEKRLANHQALTPVAFLERAARVYGARTAVIHGDLRRSYADFYRRCRQLAGALRARGIGRDDVVAVLAPNTPEMLEAHYGVPMAGAVLAALNIRLDAAAIAFILDHSGARVLLVDPEFAGLARAALSALADPPLVIDLCDPLAPRADPVGAMEYESFLATSPEGGLDERPEEEWQAIALNYTSGTTGNPKGVVYHHRGAYLNACGNTLAFTLTPTSVYLWTLPMFHCNGWSYPWAVTLQGGTHVCLRRVEPVPVFDAIARHGVTHLCAAPIVLGMMLNADASVIRRPIAPVHVATGGAPPPSRVIARMEEMGFSVTHLYGLTESFGPATICMPQPGLADLPLEDRALFTLRQGVPHPTAGDAQVIDPDTMRPVPADGVTMGELMLRGNTVMKGYLKNLAATEEAFSGGWFHTGDLAVMHPDGYVELKDRAKDIIISGGENISSVEVEEVLYRHPDVIEAAVVAWPDPKWGETPHAFVTLRPGAPEDAAAITAWCRQHLAHFKCPRLVTFGPLPKTATGKIQKYELRKRATETS
jgi:fatty-acyl-CoA synthase